MPITSSCISDCFHSFPLKNQNITTENKNKQTNKKNPSNSWQKTLQHRTIVSSLIKCSFAFLHCWPENEPWANEVPAECHHSCSGRNSKTVCGLTGNGEEKGTPGRQAGRQALILHITGDCDVPSNLLLPASTILCSQGRFWRRGAEEAAAEKVLLFLVHLLHMNLNLFKRMYQAFRPSTEELWRVCWVNYKCNQDYRKKLRAFEAFFQTSGKNINIG